MSEIPQIWLDLAALVGPNGCNTDPLPWISNLDWYEIYALSATNLIAPTLYTNLVKYDRLQFAPIEVQEGLRELHRLNKSRNSRQRFVLHDTIRILNARGVEPILLKGSISLVVNQYSELSDRMMSDLDIALHNAPAEKGEEALIQAGYWHAKDQGPAEYNGHHHLAPLFHPSGEGYVEIHRELMDAKIPKNVLSLDQVRASSVFLNWEGLRLWIPSVEHRIIHNALHHQVQDADNYSDRCSLRQLLEFVQLNRLSAAEGMDWNVSLKHFDNYGLGDPIRVYLLLAERFFHQTIPEGVTIGKHIRRAESMIWFWFNHTRLFRCYKFSTRLRRLPVRLLTPSWYPKKYQQILRDWRKN